VALPRRDERKIIRGYAVGAGFALLFVGPEAIRGAEPMVSAADNGGAKPPPHIERQSRIKDCAMTIIGFVAVSVIFLIFADKDYRPAGGFMRILIAFLSIVIASAAAMFELILRNAVDIKSQNDLTV